MRNELNGAGHHTASETWMAAQASLRSLRKLDCERGHDGGEIVVYHRQK